MAAKVQRRKTRKLPRLGSAKENGVNGGPAKPPIRSLESFKTRKPDYRCHPDQQPRAHHKIYEKVSFLRLSSKHFPHCSTAVSTSGGTISPPAANTPPEVIPVSSEKAYATKFFNKMTEAEKWELEQDLLNAMLNNAWGKPDAATSEIQEFKKDVGQFFDKLVCKQKVLPSSPQACASSSLATTSSELENLRSSYQELETKLKEAEQKKEQAEKLAEKNSELIREKGEFLLKRNADSETIKRQQKELNGLRKYMETAEHHWDLLAENILEPSLYRALVKFDFLMDSLKEKDESIEELEYHLNDKERRFNLLRQELKTERCISQGLKQQIETYELDKVKDLETIERAQSLTQELNASKEELEVAHASLTRDLDHLERANKLVKDELKKLGKNHDLLQETYSKALESMNDSIVDKNVASSSTTFTSEHAKLVAEHVRLQEELSLHVETNTYLESLVTKYGLNYYPNESACEQATTLEENVRLKKELAKFTTTKSKMGLDDLLSKQRSNKQKYGLGYVPKPYKKNNYKKEKPAQEENKKGYSSGGSKWVFDSGCTNHMTGGRGVLDQFIEDINKKSSITFGDNSKGKDETHREFITFAKKAQRTYESEIKAIRTDNGTEFKNYTMQEFVDDEGIKHEFSAPYTPQQNGVVERKNRTIIEMARTMLSEFNSPHNFWGEAISTAVHYSNRLFLRPLHNKTPYELLTGNKPNVMYIRVFGCKCLVKNNKGKLGKFETRTIEGIFVGYAENSHAYRYYNRSTGTIEVSCDVVFLEDNGSQVEQVVPCVAGNDDDPSSAIKHMGIGHIRPMEVHSDDQGGSSDDDRGGLAKRGRTVPRPPGYRTSNRKSTKAPQFTDIGSSARGGHKSTGNKRKDKQAAQEYDEIVPDFNVADANRLDWQDLRTVNPYRYEQRTYTGGDRFFWTKTQAALWVGYYDNTHECMKNGAVVKPKAINPEELALHEATKYRFVIQTLKGMGLYDLVCLKPDDDQEDPTYCPLLVRQFHCTVFFHDDADRTMTWMTGREKYSCTYTQFCEAMGYEGGRSTGYRIHTRPKLASGDISFCYPGPTAGPPTISGMYYSYLVLAKMFLMDRMTPNYTQYVQRLINHIVPAPLNTRDERVIMPPFKFPAPEGRPEVPSMMPANERRSKEHHDPAASSSYSWRPKHGVARFFSCMWQMCKNTNDVAHQSLALNQETRRRQNEFMATRNVPVPPPGPELAPVVAPQWEMPPLTDEMIQNFDFSMYAHGGLPPRTARTPTPPADDGDGDGDGDEDEGDAVMMTRAPTPPGMSSIDGCNSISPLSFAFLVFRCQRGRRE
ncbi:hypothetical protein QYE76_012730 [Lolium multiflorum]|uniref:Integrase catalytic domain-containing protein n=1 Tax=Lolium multiflorum TaxID=4521 RepID=A0AAD8X3X2_LOLMU|nr:hypothetical protein QYE76_012730 [Lolium multiflorum]